MSAIHSSSGWEATDCRWTRSNGLSATSAGKVVRFVRHEPRRKGRLGASTHATVEFPDSSHLFSSNGCVPNNLQHQNSWAPFDPSDDKFYAAANGSDIFEYTVTPP